MDTTVVVGGQWGDEGKAKIIDYLSENQDLVIRYQGGSNAGHTVIVGDKKYVFHLVPTGIIYANTICIVSNGVVLDPKLFFEEIAGIEANGLNCDGRVFISDRAHIVMPYNKELDGLYEEQSGGKIGTTKRGIGYAYSDKINRIGIRAIDLLDKENLCKVVTEAVARHECEYKMFGAALPNVDAIVEEYYGYGQKMKDMVIDTVSYINNAIDAGKKVLFEGAQGAALDVDFGTYPYVTSSSTTSSGACTGAGVAPTKIKRIFGIFKAYTTRVGGGPFPSRLSGEEEETLRQKGGEFGATTGRPRGCGWLDMVQARYSSTINGCTDIALTKIDILSGYDTIHVCEAYEIDGKVTREFVALSDKLDRVKPVLKSMKGWKEDISKCTCYDELPAEAKALVEYVEQELKARVSIVSVGPDRTQTFNR